MTVDPLAAIIPELGAPWRTKARCAGTGTLMFDDATETQARALCRACPVRVECLAYALERAEPEGIWGGFTPDERRKISHDITHGSSRR